MTNGIKQKLIEEFQKAFSLTLYFGIWFCAITFLGATSLYERPIPLSIFGFALIKAGLCAKFMLIAQAISPIKVDKTHGILKSLFLESLIYIAVVLALNYIEAGIDGLIHGKAFFESMATFGQANPMRVVAMLILYWLIVWPYLILVGTNMALGKEATLAILFGSKK